ncbi:MFS transporter [Desulfitobacterium sp. THU1]|uniref:MFS transporter n=1 Tax=Desulfitobacterium sp. THU1 TaxID=3138072 RepID=UPI00311D8CEB
MEQNVSKSYKYWVLFTLFLGWLIASMDRAVMSIALIPLTEEFGLNPATTGIVMSSFFLGFIIMQFPGGFLADKYGAKKVLLIAIISWSLFTGLTGLAWSLTALLVFRFLFGIFEGFFPSASSILVAQNFPLTQRARAKTIVLLASGVGGILAAVGGAALVESLGWRAMFWILSGFGVLIFLLFVFKVQDHHKAKKQDDIVTKEPVHKVPVREVLKNPLVWSLLVTSLGIYIVNWGISSWMPIYLVQARGLSMMEMGTLIAISGLIMMVVALLVGYILDKITGKERYAAAGGAVFAALFLYLLANAPTPVMAVVYQTLAQAACSFVTFTVLTQPLKRFPVEAIGTANGIINTGGQIGSFVSPMAMGFIIQASGGSYTSAFMFLAACTVISAIAGATIPVVKTPAKSGPAAGAEA